MRGSNLAFPWQQLLSPHRLTWLSCTTDGRLDLALVLNLALDVARAMVYLHSRDIIHGDLKARNVLLKSGSSEPGRALTAKVADFGLSQPLVSGQHALGSSCQGTLTHMAPEVLAHGQVGGCCCH